MELPRTASLVALAAAAALALPAAADPVAAERAAVAYLVVGDEAGAHVRLQVDVTDGAARDLVSVVVTRCHATECEHADVYEGPAAPGAATVAVDAASARFAGRVGGRDLVLEWETTGEPGAVLGGSRSGGYGAEAASTTFVGTPAQVRVSAAGDTCSGRGGVGDAVRVAVPEGAVGGARPLSALRLPRGPVSCA